MFLTNEKINLISDTVHGTIQISEIEKNVISTSIFNRLHNISQNSTAYMTYPTNKTKRFEHSIGTMHLAGAMFTASVANAESKTVESFFQCIREIVNGRIRCILDNEVALYRHEINDNNMTYDKLSKYDDYDFSNGLQNKWIPANVNIKDRFLCLVVTQSVRLSALLHDVGHPPFSHITENALKQVWEELDKKDEQGLIDEEKEYYKNLEKYFKNNGELHEQIGNAITERLLQSIIEPMPKKDCNKKEYLAQQLYLIMIKEMTNAILNEKKQIFKNLHGLNDGSLDCDRLDYVTRDMVNSGIDSGKIEYERLISTIKLIKSNNGDFIFCPSIKVLRTIEDFFMRRWNLYKKIIFHHRVIKTDYLLGDCIKSLINNYFNSKVDLKKNIKILPYDISGLWKAVKSESSDDVLFNKLIQWDDCWLMVVLKKEFYQFSEEDTDNKILTNKLNELLANKKFYYSIIKDSDNFISIENNAVKVLKKGIIEVEEIYNKVLKKSNQDDNTKNLIIDPFLDDVIHLIEYIKNYDENSFRSKGFLIRKLDTLIFANYISDNAFSELVKESAEHVINDIQEINDLIIVFKSIKSGVQESLLLYNSNGDTKKFKDISNIGTLLLFEKSFLPPFYVYISKEDEDTKIDFENIKSKLGIEIAKRTLFKLEEILKQYN